MADKNALERIGLMLFAATLFVVGAAGFAVHHQLSTDSQSELVAVAQIPGQIAAIKADVAMRMVK